MKNKTISYLVAIVLSLSSVAIFAAECDNPKTSDEVAQCIGLELRDADARINTSYKELMGKLDDGGKKNLKTAQRVWIKDRDSVCRLDTRETNREKWYQALLKDYPKTVCVTRYTRKRTAELDAMLGNPSAQSGKSDPAPASHPPVSKPSGQDVAPGKQSVTTHTNGKWYFEYAINYAEAVSIEPTVLTMGVSDKDTLSGILENIRIKDAGKDIVRFGFAVDLDNGKLYISRNGQWLHGAPGSNQGQDLKLGRTYYGLFMVSADSVRPYLDKKAIAPNFGGANPMAYALPNGYSPWHNRTQ